MRTETYPSLIGFAGIVIASIILVLGLSGCSSENGGRRQKTGNRAVEQIVCRLKWLPNVSAAGEIWAKQSGIFKKEGMNVELKEGGLEHDAIRDLELGRADFGVASADQVLRASEKGAHIVVIAQIFQKNPLKWIYNSSRIHIKTPKDLQGLKIGITYGGNDEAIFKALIARYDISKDDIQTYA
ncbi:MAG: ABC transporter substrate-binding protein, partial [Dissulfurimicrobium sp.]